MQRCRSVQRACQIMASETPGIYEQLEQIRDQPAALAFWAGSYNFDENARLSIVHPRILEAIGTITDCDLNGPPFHAGLLHTYGYLFSVIDTPFGKKRDRWLNARIARGFKLAKSLLGPQPAAGTLLTNLTYFVGSITYRDDPRQLRKIQQLRSQVADQIVDYDYARPTRRRLIEKAVVPRPQRRMVRLVTDLAPFFPARKNHKHVSSLLIYSTKDGTDQRLLNTVFEMKARNAAALWDGNATVISPQIRPRYNSAITGFSAALNGKREWVSPT